MKYTITPVLVDKKHMHELYGELLNKEYKVKIWSKKEDLEFYDYFLPAVREFMFWTFNMNGNDKFKAMDSEMTAAICNKYTSTTFEKGENKVVCFYSGIVFVVGKSEEISNYQYIQNIEKVNIDKNKFFSLQAEDEKELYNYIACLYKFVLLRKLEIEMDKKNAFDKNRKTFVKFIEEIYNKKITDDPQGSKLTSKWEKELEIEKSYIAIENKFDLLYRNNQLDGKDNMMKAIIVLLVVVIIIGILNLGNWMS